MDLPRLQGGLQAINEGGFVESFASEKLAKIRRRIQENEHQVREILQDLLKSKADMLADAVIASRNGRNVLPVKHYHLTGLRGGPRYLSQWEYPFISSTRQSSILMKKLPTIEPMNAMKSFRFWRNCSDTLRPHAAEIANNAWIIGHLDLIKAKYRFMRDCGSSNQRLVTIALFSSCNYIIP